MRANIRYKGAEYTRKIVYTAVFSALIAAGAFIKIPTPLVPVTMQSAFCMLAAMLLGWKLSCAAVAVYVLAGLCGLPVFTAGGGVQYALYPTFGYLLGMILGTALAGVVARGAHNEKAPSFRRNLLAAAVCQAAVYAVGVPYMYLISTMYLGRAMTAGAAVISGWLIFIPTDVMWCGLSAAVAAKLVPILSKSGVYISVDADKVRDL